MWQATVCGKPLHLKAARCAMLTARALLPSYCHQPVASVPTATIVWVPFLQGHWLVTMRQLLSLAVVLSYGLWCAHLLAGICFLLLVSPPLKAPALFTLHQAVAR